MNPLNALRYRAEMEKLGKRAGAGWGDVPSRHKMSELAAQANRADVRGAFRRCGDLGQEPFSKFKGLRWR
jgi:hypothetical protein